MKRFFPKLLATVLLTSFVSAVHAAEFDWGELESVFDNPVVDELIDSSRSRRSEIEKPRRKQPRKTMRYDLDYAVGKVRREYKGKVIGASTSWRGDEAVHRVKLLTNDGRVRTIYISGTSGR